ncbi:16227_t:CDS:2 [Entrophospora sp. SA101]|nr:16227_t:CDS:2 [Entrophospora sp. SA101]
MPFDSIGPGKIQYRIIACYKLLFAETAINLLGLERELKSNHAKFLHELPDEYLGDLLPVAKRVALAVGAEQYNILQNNGPLAHQIQLFVDCHMARRTTPFEQLDNPMYLCKVDFNSIKQICKNVDFNIAIYLDGMDIE